MQLRIKCHKLHAVEQPILEETLLQVPIVTHMIIPELEQMGCVELRDGYLYTNSHEATISDGIFTAVQQEKVNRSKGLQN